MTNKIALETADASSVSTASQEHNDDESSCTASCRSGCSKMAYGTLQRRLTHPMRILRRRAASHFHRRLYGGTGVAAVDRFFVRYNITLGQLHLLVPLLVCITMVLYYTFPRPNTGQSGMWAYYALMYTFLLAHKQASLFQLIGLSWEQLVTMHKVASFVSMALSLLHAYVAYTGHDYIPCREPTTTNLLVDEITESSSDAPICEDLHEYMNKSADDSGRRHLGELRLEDNPRYRHSLIGPDTNLWKFLWDGGRNISGSWMITCLLVLLLLSSFRATFRKPCFDLWLAMHIAAAGAIIAYADKHRVKLFIVLVVWWGVDGLLRYGLGSLLRLPKTATMKLLTKQPAKGKFFKGDGSPAQSINNAIVELSFDTKFHYEAGQYIRVAIMETGQPVMFHPMTISSAPYQDTVTLHFRPFGGWTNQLARMAAARSYKTSSRNGQQEESPAATGDQEQPSAATTATAVGYKVHVLLEGPYGNLAMNLLDDPDRFPVVVLIAGGVGVTPMSSLARQLLHEHNAGRQRQQIRVVWAVRDMALVETLPVLGPDSFNSAPKNKSKSPKNNRTVEEIFVDTEEALFEPILRETVLKVNVFMTAKSTVTKTKRQTKVSDEFFVDEPDYETSIDRILKDREAAAPPLSKTQKSMDYMPVTSTYADSGYYSFHMGRPDVRALLEQSATWVEGDERVAVIACGPRSLVRSAKEACAQLTCGSLTTFDFHEEEFLY
jgi:predicted ferric reductase